jgi:DMSO reductase anchor subunit
MNPAYSVIFFTTSSGAGYGLLYWLSLMQLAGALPDSRWFAAAALTLALALVTGGLLSSALHLGRPERAHRSFSQWRSSWLSREGVASVATYAPSGLLWLSYLLDAGAAARGVLAGLSILGAVATVWCTGMIYASLRTIRQWHQPLVPWVYMALSAATGALLLAAALGLAGHGARGAGALALLALAVAAGLKAAYWRRIDHAPPRYTAAQALGMGAEGIRQIDPPHSRPNFVMREMGYAVARRHARRLRAIAAACLFAAPALLVLLALATGWALPALLAAAVAVPGLLTERWLFFAEAEHVSMLYYGRSAA